jgi:aspartate-semialdehyde dehydrogenase
MKVAVVGATGLVGSKMLEVLKERDFPLTELIPVASPRSVGSNLTFKGAEHKIVGMEQAISMDPDIALFSAGGSVSLEWAPQFIKNRCTVVDNSSAWRMNPDVKLVVPEINASELTSEDHIIANPNCSTIQLVMAMKPLHDVYGIERIVVSTYQSVTGTGVKAVSQLESERAGDQAEMAYEYPIDKNCIPHCDVFLDNGYTREEMKLVHENGGKNSSCRWSQRIGECRIEKAFRSKGNSTPHE